MERLRSNKMFLLFYLRFSPLIYFVLSVLLINRGHVLYLLYLVTTLIIIIGNKLVVKLFLFHNIEELSGAEFANIDRGYNFYILSYFVLLFLSMMFSFAYFLGGY